MLAEGVVGGYASVYGVLKVLEERGQVRRGYFVSGLGAAQFALPGAVDRLRLARERASDAIGEAGVVAPPVVLAAKPWHYWISYVLAASFLGLVLMMVVGFVVKVVMLKYGIKVGRKST